MKRIGKPVTDDEMRAEYDFTGAVRGKYYDRFTTNSNVVVLEPDVLAAFPNSASVNAALRSLVAAGKGKRVVRRPSVPTKRRSGRRFGKQSARKPR